MPHPIVGGMPREFLRDCLLLLLREREAHGYDLLVRLQPFGFDGSDPGAIYKALRRLESDRLVASRWETSQVGPRKRVYGLTEAGLDMLDVRAADLAEGERRIDAFLARYLRARQLPGGSRRRRAIAGRISAHEGAVTDRGL
jgi:PadR family transcriptional regulator, regulatory protein PadR